MAMPVPLELRSRGRRTYGKLTAVRKRMMGLPQTTPRQKNVNGVRPRPSQDCQDRPQFDLLSRGSCNVQRVCRMSTHWQDTRNYVEAPGSPHRANRIGLPSCQLTSGTRILPSSCSAWICVNANACFGWHASRNTSRRKPVRAHGSQIDFGETSLASAQKLQPASPENAPFQPTDRIERQRIGPMC